MLGQVWRCWQLTLLGVIAVLVVGWKARTTSENGPSSNEAVRLEAYAVERLG